MRLYLSKISTQTDEVKRLHELLIIILYNNIYTVYTLYAVKWDTAAEFVF